MMARFEGASLEQKRQPPIAAHVHRPVSGEISFQKLRFASLPEGVDNFESVACDERA